MADGKSLGEGRARPELFKNFGAGVVLEPGVRVFGAEWISLGQGSYVGHDSFIRAYQQGKLLIGDDCWIGPKCFINSFGQVTIGNRVGIGPGVYILSSWHRGNNPSQAIIDTEILALPVKIADGADIGAGAILLAGADIGARAQVAAGALVNSKVEPDCVVAGIPARPV